MGSSEFGDEKSLANYSRQFQEIYSDGYRQRYSEILDMLIDIDAYGDDDTEGYSDEDEDCLEVLSINLATLKEFVRTNIEEYGESTFFGIAKLSDHVDIEIHRYRDKKDMYYELSKNDDNVVALYEKIEDLDSKLSISLSDLDETHRAAEKLQMQMVAILGIFAAIVMAFSGGLDILGGAISISGDSDIFRVVFTVLLCGIILFNIFAFLMYMIMAIIHTQNTRPFRPISKNVRRKIRLSRWLNHFVGSRFIIAFNIALILAMAIDAICMIFIVR